MLKWIFKKDLSFVKTVEYGSFTKASEMLNLQHGMIMQLCLLIEHGLRVSILLELILKRIPYHILQQGN